MDKPYIVAHIEKSLEHTIFDTKWIPSSAKFVVLGSKPNGCGVLKIFEMNSGQLDLVCEFEQKSSFKCGSFGASSLRKTHMAVASLDGKLQMLDLERIGEGQAIYTVAAHEGIINCLDAIGGGTMLNCGAPEIATGGSDGFVKVWDLRQNDKPVASMSPMTEKSADKSKATASRDCWCVCLGDSYNSEERALCAGYDNGDIKMFDLRQMKLRWETNVKNGVCGLEFDRRDIKMNKLVATTLEGGLHVYDTRTLHPQKGFCCVTEKDAGRSLGNNGVISGLKATVWCARHLPQNRELFMTCGGTGAIRLWQYEYPDRRYKESSDGPRQGIAGTLQMLNATTVSTQPVNCFDWSPDRIGLAVCGAFDQTVRVLISTNLHLYK